MSTDDEDALAREAYVVHEALMAWLRATHPRVHPLSVITACSYEIGRLVALLTQDDPGVVNTEAMLAGVRNVMRDHIAACRRGLDR